MQLVPLAWMRVRVEAELCLLPFMVLQGTTISTLSRRTHPMVIDLERETTDPSIKHPHIPNIMIDRHSMESMIMVMSTRMGMGLMTSTLNRMTMGKKYRWMR